MPLGEPLLLAAGSCMSAFAAGLFLERCWSQRPRMTWRYREAYLDEKGLGSKGRFSSDADRLVLRLAVISSVGRNGKRDVWSRLLPGTARWFTGHEQKAGLQHSITAEGACRARALYFLAGSCMGALAGGAFSSELSVLLGVAGAFLGWRLLAKAVERRTKVRADEVERCLPNMLDVLVMGLRSGLSFDRSMEAYANHFDTRLARSCELARQEWCAGFSSREHALRELARSYDSVLLSRVVESIVRSLRLGSSLADDLSAIAVEARASYAACRQERAAKVPVKMMVTTGTLMLPAMLLLVLGPILLELMGGF